MSRSRALGGEVQGRALDAVVTAVSAFAPVTRMRVQSILASAEILHVTPGDWYSLDVYVDALDDIESAVGSAVLWRAGMQLVSDPTEGDERVPTTAGHPSDTALAIEQLDEAYTAVHRGGRIGGYEFQPEGRSHGIVVSTTPYPDHFDRGVLDAAFRRPDGQTLTEVATGDTFGDGSGETTFHVSW